MRRPFANRTLVWVCALVIVTAATAMFASNYVHSATTPPLVSNGGAKQWVAFDPTGRNIGPVQFLVRHVTIVNTSNAPNTFQISYEPTHFLLCAGTLGAGQMNLCGVQPKQQLFGGYFQVVAAHSVLMGGQIDAPVIRFVQNSPPFTNAAPNGGFGADPSTGIIQLIPLVWQQGCPPRHGSGCPDERARETAPRSGHGAGEGRRTPHR